MDKGSVKYLIISTIAIIVAGIILYPIMDLVYTKFITNSKFVYSVSEHILAPVGIGVIMGPALWLIDKGTSKKK